MKSLLFFTALFYTQLLFSEEKIETESFTLKQWDAFKDAYLCKIERVPDFEISIPLHLVRRGRHQEKRANIYIGVSESDDLISIYPHFENDQLLSYKATLSLCSPLYSRKDFPNDLRIIKNVFLRKFSDCRNGHVELAEFKLPLSLNQTSPLRFGLSDSICIKERGRL